MNTLNRSCLSRMNNGSGDVLRLSPVGHTGNAHGGYPLGAQLSEKCCKTREQVVNKLKHALATEYYAYHMYRSAYNKAKGLRRTSIIDELKDHASEELEHADMLEERIRILGGETFSDPTDWDIWNDPSIPSITSSDIGEILVIVRQSEQDAVELYSRLYDELSEDPVSQDMVLRILTKEQEHLFDVKYNMIGLTS